MTTLKPVQGTSFRVRTWFAHHKSEVVIGSVLAVLCAMVFGYPIALYIAPPVPAPFKIYVVAEADDHTIKQFEASKAAKAMRVGNVPVELKVESFAEADDTEQNGRDIAERVLASNDALMVVGHFASQATEAALPIYLGARPQIPFIATVQTDDDLLKKCNEREARADCTDGDKLVPLLQLSPTNAEQAKWAVQFATGRGKKRFLIATDTDPRNQVYVQSLAKAYRDEVNRLSEIHPDHHLTVVNGISLDFSAGGLREQNPDCVLYAGGIDAAGGLLRNLKGSGLAAMVVLSDSAVSRTGFISDEEMSGFTPVNFTHQIDASDYNERKDVYGMDGIAIAARLINDLNTRGLSWRFRIKSMFGMETAEDVRRDLLRVIQDNGKYRSSYLGAPETASALGPTVYAFNGTQRLGGIFHVWERSKPPSMSTSQLTDVDGWHPPRESSSSSLPRNATIAAKR